MNIIGIMLDSFRQDHISFYNGGQPVFEGIAPCQFAETLPARVYPLTMGDCRISRTLHYHK